MTDLAACHNYGCPDRATCQRARLLEQPVEPFLSVFFTRREAPEYQCYIAIEEEAA
jgi:hypothetical protein